MKSPWRSVAWGMLIMLIDIRIQGFDIVPDALGYVFAAIGILSLSPGGKAKTLAVGGLAASAVLTIAGFAGGLNGSFSFGTGQGLTAPDNGYFIAMAAGAARLVMVYGLIELLLAGPEEPGAAYRHSVLRLWSFYLTVNAVFLIGSPFLIVHFAGSDTTLFLLLLTVAALAAETAFVWFLFRRAPAA